MRQKIDVTPLQEMLSLDIEPLSLKQKLADIRYNYTNYVLKDPDACGPQDDVADEAFWLKQLEERLQSIYNLQFPGG